MARSQQNSLLAVILLGPGAVGLSALALWENEGRFDYYRAARETTVIATPAEAGPLDVVSLTGTLDTSIPIPTDYVEPFVGYLRVRRYAEIYSWQEDEDDDGSTTWSQGWYSTVQSNRRNGDIRQRLSSGTLYPPRYELAGAEIARARIHLVDSYEPIATGGLGLSSSGRGLGLETSPDHLYLRESPDTETLGDERLIYVGVPAEPEATYFGVIEDGVGVGREFERHEGLVSALIRNDGILHHLVNGGRDEALSKVRFDFLLTKWLVRIAGTFGMVVGFWILFGRFASLLFRLRWLRGLVRVGVLVLGVAVGVPVALIVIASSMAIHSPFIAALPMALGVGAAVYFLRRSRVTRRNVETRLGDRDMEATFSRLVSVARVESGLDPKERRFLKRWGKKNGVPAARMGELLSEEGEQEIEAGSRDDLELLVYVALVDGVLSSREWSVLEGLAKRLDLGREELEEIVFQVEETVVHEA